MVQMAIKINIDAGHGTNTAGKRTPPFPREIKINNKLTVKKGEQFREHIANVGVAFLLEQELKRCGFETFRTGWNDNNAFDDPDTPLAERQRAIAKANCDYSVSIHFNAYGDGKSFNSAEGIGIYIHNRYQNRSKKLAETVLKHLTQGTKQKNRGVTSSSLAMCNCNNMDVKAAILVELAFMTNLREATELMASEQFWKECAVEIARGLCEYIGFKYIPESYIPAKTITPKTSKEDIKWLQAKLNAVLPNWLPKLKVDGDYGPKTRIGVLVYWDQLGWGKHLRDDGTRAGKSTRQALTEGKKA
jgi:N-acetylmuramoyl-L-alanine amidase